MDSNIFLFDFSGRLNRARYWLGIVVSSFLIVLMVVLFAITFVKERGLAVLVVPLLLICLAGIVLYSLAIQITRLHDRNKSGWWVMVFSVLPGTLDALGRMAEHTSHGSGAVLTLVALPFSIWGFVEMGCLRGSDGPNRFGSDPLAKPEDEAHVFA